MGKNNQQRRAAKRRARAAGRPPGAAGVRNNSASRSSAASAGPLGSEPRAVALIQAAVEVVEDAAAFDDAVRDLVVFSSVVPPVDADVAERVVSQLLLMRIGECYESGWQPLDLLHVVRRESPARLVGLAADAILQQAAVQRAATRAPEEWLGQLESIAEGPLPTDPKPAWNVIRSPGPWRAGVWDVWHHVLLLLGRWLSAVPLPRLVPPPSAWSARRAVPTTARPTAGHDPKKLATIRALLAKAEATEFAEEADAFTAKAQDLMTRYAIDEALLADPDEAVDIRSRRVHIDNPYAATKAQLLATVGKVNLVKTIWDDQHGIATIVGLPVDLDLSEMLFTSLLLQATKAMTEAGSVSRGGRRLDRSPSFRRAFLLSYANRIGERLTEAGQHAQQEESVARGRDLVPVFARQSAAVDTEFARLFPRTTSSGAKRVDARGWQAGRAAADRAILARGQVDGRSA